VAFYGGRNKAGNLENAPSEGFWYLFSSTEPFSGDINYSPPSGTQTTGQKKKLTVKPARDAKSAIFVR